VTYATTAGGGGGTNIVRPLYHVSWLASRLGWSTIHPLTPGPDGRWTARMRRARGEVAVSLVPERSTSLPPGSTLRIALVAERQHSVLEADVSAHEEAVLLRARLDGVETVDRVFRAARRTDAGLLAEAIESGGRDPVTTAAISAAAEIVGTSSGPA
jgi:hypothetical protein